MSLIHSLTTRRSFWGPHKTEAYRTYVKSAPVDTWWNKEMLWQKYLSRFAGYQEQTTIRVEIPRRGAISIGKKVFFHPNKVLPPAF